MGQIFSLKEPLIYAPFGLADLTFRLRRPFHSPSVSLSSFLSLHSFFKSQEEAGEDEAITPELKIELLKASICYSLTVL